MNKSIFNPQNAYVVVIYARMSSSMQNERSPEQQIDNIKSLIARLKYPWIVKAVYIDRGESGRRTINRPNYLRMLSDLSSGMVKADLILVDSSERFGRNDGVQQIRKRLRNKHGVLILTADSNFSDPTTSTGEIVSAFEAIRASSEHTVKAHNVRRGKVDTAKRKRWPGGPVPFGFSLSPIYKNDGVHQEFDYSTLIPHPEHRPIIEQVYSLAADRAWGPNRIASYLNDDTDFIHLYGGKVSSATVKYWLASRIYSGDLLYDVNRTELVDETRTVKRNDVNCTTEVLNFCEPIISKELWDRVQVIARERQLRWAASRKKRRCFEGKLVQPSAPGLALTYALSGLVKCECGRRMAVSSGPAYTRKDGRTCTYPAYSCPASHSGACENKTRVPEPWLRSQTLAFIREELFPICDECNMEQFSNLDCVPDAILELQEMVTNFLKFEKEQGQIALPDLQREASSVQRQIDGWMKSLSDPNLPAFTRSSIQNMVAEAGQKKMEIDNKIHELQNTENLHAIAVAPEDICRNLMRLDAVLEGADPTRLNLELSQHIDSIECSRDRTVKIRLCILGLVPKVQTLIGRSTEFDNLVEQDQKAIHSRRRTLLRVGCDMDDEIADSLADMAANSDRFAGIGNEWFSEKHLVIPESSSWVKEHAEKVFLRRQEARLSCTQLATEFGVSRPTIAAAVRYHLRIHPESVDITLRTGGKRKPKIDLDGFADEALTLFNQGWSKLRLAERFGCSTPVISKALQHASSKSGELVASRNAAIETMVAQCRDLHDKKVPLKEISRQLGLSTTTLRKYLNKSYASEGLIKPDLRRK